jgi:hypothetical protein
VTNANWSNLLYEALRRTLWIRPFFLPRIPFMRPIILQRYFVLLVALLLSACGFVRTGYDQLDTITYWWMNRYLDFNDVQAREVKADIKIFHAWHRSTQLPAYADILAELQQMAKTEVSPAAACDIIAKARDRADMLLLQTAPQVSALALSLEPSNMKRLRKKMIEEDNDWREKWLDISPEKLTEDRSDQWRDRSEFFYGRLNAAQKQAIAEAIARSSMNPKISWMLRQKRQEDILATLEKIRTSRPSRPMAEAEIRALIERSIDPEDSAGAAMRRNLVNEACVNAAVIHQLATPAQRKRAQEKLSELEQDFRKLAAR